MQVKCWALGRSTFRNVLSDSAFKRRRRFGELLDRVTILSGITCAFLSNHYFASPSSPTAARLHLSAPPGRCPVCDQLPGAFAVAWISCPSRVQPAILRRRFTPRTRCCRREYKRRQLADALVPMSYSKGEKIITQNVLEGVRFHIIERGTVRLAAPRRPQPFERFGAQHLAALHAGIAISGLAFASSWSIRPVPAIGGAQADELEPCRAF